METFRHYILEDGELKAVDLMTWGRWFENGENRRVALTEVSNVKISTVFLGIDHAFGNEPPLWFETMIFDGDHDEYQERYTTLEEAMIGHERAVAMIKGETNHVD